jgi:TolB protein
VNASRLNGAAGHRARSDRPLERRLLFAAAFAVGLIASVGTASGGSAPLFWGTGGKIAFTREHTGGDDIFTMNADGSHQRRLTRSLDFDTDAVWSPDARKIAFTRLDPAGIASRIFKMNADGTQVRQLTHSASGSEFVPAWSGSGKQIAFVSSRDGDLEIFKMNADGTRVRQLTDNGIREYEPCWSPSGKRIAFSSNRDGDEEIFTMRADGSRQHALTDNTFPDNSPAWSPNGKKIAFSSDRNGDGAPGIYKMNADGGHQMKLTHNTDSNIEPAWSPSGKQITYINDGGGDFEIFRMLADGSLPKQLTDNTVLDYFRD